MISPQFPCARKTGLVVQDMPDEVLVYDLDTNKAHCLNRSAALVWRSCDGQTSIADIARLVEKQIGDKVSEDFIWLAIDQLNENALLESEIKSAFAGRSRRDVIKKIGLASVVAMPIIASLMAPSSAFAASSCNCTSTPCAFQSGCGSVCGGSGKCDSGPIVP
jgi:hypothetical protein